MCPSNTQLSMLEEKIRTECPLLGKQVEVAGTSRADLNGRAGVATSFDHARVWYVVELDGSGTGEVVAMKWLESGSKWQFKLENSAI